MSGQGQSQRIPVSAANAPKQKICEKCGTKFDCFSNGGPCWCEDIKLKSETLADLRNKYGDCLCPACLAKSAGQSFPRV